MAKCFFCNCHIGSSEKVYQEGPNSFNCKYCGNYSLAKGAKDHCEKYPEFRAKAAAISQEMHLLGCRDKYTLCINPSILPTNSADAIYIDNIPFLANYPKDYLEIMDRVLMNIGRKTSFSPLNEFRPSIFEFGLFFVNPKPTYYQEDHNGTLLENEAWFKTGLHYYMLVSFLLFVEEMVQQETYVKHWYVYIVQSASKASFSSGL